MSSWTKTAAAAGLLALAGCGEKAQPAQPADDELTIVVEADRSRIEIEEASLLEQRRALEAERDRLHQEISKIGAAPGEGQGPEVQRLLDQAVTLVRRQEELVGKRDALAKERDELLEKMLGENRPLTAASSPGQGPGIELARVTREAVERERDVAGREKTMAERERLLAEREKALAAREAAMAQREASCAASVARAPERGSELTRVAVGRAYRSMVAAMDSKGILSSDLPPAKQQAFQQATALQSHGDLGKALEAIDAVQSAIEAIAVDADFVSQKVKRVNAMKSANLEAKAQQEVGKLLQEVTRAYSDGRYLEANRGLNSIAHLIGKGRR